MDCTGACDPVCDVDGRCWLWDDGWTAEAQAITWQEIAEGVLAGTLVPVPGDPTCWQYAPDGHTCVIERACDMLVGRPIVEVQLTATACAGEGDWDWTGIDNLGFCWGVFEDHGVTVRLREHEGGQACSSCSPAEYMCLPDTRCFAKVAGWSAWALISTEGQTQLLQSVSTPVDLGGGIECYDFNHFDWVQCIARVECQDLVMVPMSQLELDPSGTSCADYLGPWDSVATITGATPCVGVFDGLADEPLGTALHTL